MSTSLVCICCRATLEFSMAGCICPASKRCQGIEAAYWLTGWNKFKGKVYCAKCIQAYDWVEKSINMTHHFEKDRHLNCFNNVIVKDGSDGRNVILVLPPSISGANNSLNVPPLCTPPSTNIPLPPGLQQMNLQQALSLVDELRQRIETLEKGNCLIGALQARLEVLENDDCKRARCPSGDEFRMVDDAKVGEFK